MRGRQYSCCSHQGKSLGQRTSRRTITLVKASSSAQQQRNPFPIPASLEPRVHILGAVSVYPSRLTFFGSESCGRQGCDGWLDEISWPGRRRPSHHLSTTTLGHMTRLSKVRREETSGSVEESRHSNGFRQCTLWVVPGQQPSSTFGIGDVTP